MGRGRAADARDGPHLRPHRRVRLVEHRAGAGPARLGLARPRDGNTWRRRAARRALHANGHAAALADRAARGDPARRCRGARPRLRLPAPHHFLRPGLAGRRPAYHRARRRPLRQPPGARGLAARQRVRLPRHRALLRPGGSARLPGLAAPPLSVARAAERGVGQPLLVHGDRRLRRGDAPRGRGHGDEPRRPARLLALRLRPGGGVRPDAGGRDPAALAGPLHHPQLHGTVPGVRPLAGRRRAGLRDLGLLPARLHRAVPLHARGARGLHRDRAPRHGGLPPRPLPRASGAGGGG